MSSPSRRTRGPDSCCYWWKIEAALDSLQRAVEERDALSLDLPCKPIWDPVRADPRFAALLRTCASAEARAH